MSTQSNTSFRSGTTAVERTVIPSALTLHFDYGFQLELLHWALSDLKQRFYNEIADHIGQRRALSYVETMSNIQEIDSMLSDMFAVVNHTHADLAHGEDKVYRDEDELQKQACELAQKLGWEM